jgi:hypothetical protein
MCRFDPNGVTAQRPVESAHRALVRVGAQNLFGEPAAPLPGTQGAPPLAPGQVQGSHVEVDPRADQLGEDRREVLVQQQPGGDRRGDERSRRMGGNPSRRARQVQEETSARAETRRTAAKVDGSRARSRECRRS